MIEIARKDRDLNDSFYLFCRRVYKDEESGILITELLSPEDRAIEYKVEKSEKLIVIRASKTLAGNNILLDVALMPDYKKLDRLEKDIVETRKACMMIEELQKRADNLFKFKEPWTKEKLKEAGYVQ